MIWIYVGLIVGELGDDLDEAIVAVNFGVKFVGIGANIVKLHGDLVRVINGGKFAWIVCVLGNVYGDLVDAFGGL